MDKPTKCLTRAQVIERYDVIQTGTVFKARGRSSSECPMCLQKKTKQALVCSACFPNTWVDIQPALPPASSLQPNNVELAWVAGIIDGEGCISIQARPQPSGSICHTCFLKITMGHKPTIELLRDLFGIGSVTIQDKHGPRTNDSWTWWTASCKAHAVICKVRPYLVTKAYEADIALEFLSLPSSKRGRNRINPELIVERERLRLLISNAKPTARFREEKNGIEKTQGIHQLVT